MSFKNLLISFNDLKKRVGFLFYNAHITRVFFTHKQSTYKKKHFYYKDKYFTNYEGPKGSECVDKVIADKLILVADKTRLICIKDKSKSSISND